MASGSSAANRKEPASFRQKAVARIAKVRKWVKAHRPPFLLQLSYWALVIIAFVVGAYFLFSWVLNPTDHEQPQEIDITRMALTVAAGFGGLVALVVAYRKQRDMEEGRFVERFGSAAEQLGHTDVAVRMAGVYAMAGVADRTRNIEQRQQCIDVLCGYLRLPYEPQSVEDHQTLMIVRTPERAGMHPSREIHYQYRQNDREVRQTIVRVIADHLRREVAQSWSQCSFDFTNVHFENPDFSRSNFNGEETSFSGAIFDGKSTSFSGVTFGGESTWFEEATFGGEGTWFEGATFGAERTSFDGVRFGGDVTSFEGATFDGKHIGFMWAKFSGGNTSFSGATFSGEYVSFELVIFGQGHVNFEFPKRWNPAPKFDWDEPEPRIRKPENVWPHVWPPTPRPDWRLGES